jgi:hypothetical protein
MDGRRSDDEGKESQIMVGESKRQMEKNVKEAEGPTWSFVRSRKYVRKHVRSDCVTSSYKPNPTLHVGQHPCLTGYPKPLQIGSLP